MTSTILVSYATKYGSTQEIAEAIALRLRERSLEVDIQPMKKVRTIAQYQAVVLGAPMYMFHMMKDFFQFLSRFQNELVEKPAAIFSLGPFNDVEKEWNGVREQFDKELAKVPWLNPLREKYLAGSSTLQRCDSRSLCYLLSSKSLPVILEIGRRSAIGQMNLLEYFRPNRIRINYK